MKDVYSPPTLNDGSPVDPHGREIDRLFMPIYSGMYHNVHPAQLITYAVQQQVQQLQIWNKRTNAIEPDSTTVVLSIDGACRDNGRPLARGSWAVYAGPNSRFNDWGRLDPNVPQTNSRAEIEALASALTVVKRIGYGDVKIRCDSEYLCKAMSMWMGTWLENGGLRPNGKPVVHFEKLKEIHDIINDMVYGGEGHLRVQLWHVPREQNREADHLANKALDEK